MDQVYAQAEFNAGSTNAILSGSVSFSTFTLGLETDSLERSWMVNDLLGTGMVVQHIDSVVMLPNGNIQTNSFYEAWSQVNGIWLEPEGNIDTFAILPGHPGVSLYVSGEAYYYPGVVYRPFSGISSVLVPGLVSQAGGLPSCYCQSDPMLGRSRVGPVSVKFNTTSH